ncbi:hypothetical protein [Curtobacterium sp. MCBD17_040]|uniref:hypothetical protein n=1 Tax=Curtobacterium sp. MCBD17_040 TaxID=2175674 RepID=UPI000DA9EBE9|nr:hypothetical protein [Curtobacterium sp. MCBD17_040]WIB65535.1 hypothetical protein DEI94_19365 [Curtobacterium sp. MCBD17_040]
MLHTTDVPTTTLAAGSVNLSGSWSTLWGAISSATGWSHVQTFLSVIGVVIIIGSIAVYLFERRRGGGGRHMNILWAGLFGALLAAPSLIIPTALSLIDFVIGVLVNSVGSLAGH